LPSAPRDGRTTIEREPPYSPAAWRRRRHDGRPTAAIGAAVVPCLHETPRIRCAPVAQPFPRPATRGRSCRQLGPACRSWVGREPEQALGTIKNGDEEPVPGDAGVG
jgi:hypothetical protein